MGVQDQIQQDLLQAPAIHPYAARARLQRHLELNGLLQNVLEDRAHLPDHVVRIQEVRAFDALLAERQEPGGEHVRPLRGRDDRLKLIPVHIVVTQLLAHQLRVRPDHGQQVVELMGYPAREPCHDLHALLP